MAYFQRVLEAEMEEDFQGEMVEIEEQIKEKIIMINQQEEE